MKLVFTGTFDIDYKKEKERLMKAFGDNKPARDRQLHMLELFREGKLREWQDAYDALPYNEEGEYPEQEHIGMIFHDILRELCFPKFTVSNINIVK
jgi:hypothetical protein